MGKITQIHVLIVVATLFGICSIAWSDCGSVPFYAPTLDSLDIVVINDHSPKDIEFDPLKVTIFEPKQRALILWDGREEILLLSTDQRATEQTAVLEVIPLPSKPSVRLGSFETFEKAQKLVLEKRMWACAHGGAKAGLTSLPESAGKIVFEEKLGVHDISVAEAINSDKFVNFVQSYLWDKYKTPQAPIKPEFVAIIQSYLDEGFEWFVFDVITLGDSTKTREPIEYRFKSDCVFYPMRISTQERGKTEVEILAFTKHGADNFEGLDRKYFKIDPQLDITKDELEGLNKNWQEFFGELPVVFLDQWKIEGDISTFVNDIKVK